MRPAQKGRIERLERRLAPQEFPTVARLGVLLRWPEEREAAEARFRAALDREGGGQIAWDHERQAEVQNWTEVEQVLAGYEGHARLLFGPSGQRDREVRVWLWGPNDWGLGDVP